jgi:hypothetical protein
MIMIRFRSVRFGMLRFVLLHDFGKLLEEIVRVMRAGCRFGMVLDAKHRLATMAQPFHGLIVEVEMSDLDMGITQRAGIHAKAVILGGDLYFIGSSIQHRMICAVVSKL